MSKLTAIPFGEDGTCGDSSYYADPAVAVTYEDGLAFDQLRQRFMEAQQFTAEDCEDLKGFWVLTEEHVAAIEAVWGEDIPGNDSALYRLNSAAKRLASHLAIKTITKDNQAERAEL